MLIRIQSIDTAFRHYHIVTAVTARCYLPANSDAAVIIAIILTDVT
jgi:hypothetical protein